MPTTRRISGDPGAAQPSPEARNAQAPGAASAPAPSRRSTSSAIPSDDADTADHKPKPSPAAAETRLEPVAAKAAPLPEVSDAEIAEDDISEAAAEPDSPKTDPEPVAAKAVAALLDVPDSAPPSIPSAAAAPLDTSGRGGAPVLPGHIIANRYEVLGVLGEGGMGIVYRCKDKPTGQSSRSSA